MLFLTFVGALCLLLTSTSVSGTLTVLFAVTWLSFLTCSLYTILTYIFLFPSTESYPHGPSSGHSARPKLRPFSFDTNLIDHKSVRVFCQLDSGSQPVSFKWLKDGSPLSPASGHIKIEGSSDYSSLAIASLLGRRDNGNYSCLATNSHGTERSSATLLVQGESSTSLDCLLSEIHPFSLSLPSHSNSTLKPKTYASAPFITSLLETFSQWYYSFPLWDHEQTFGLLFATVWCKTDVCEQETSLANECGSFHSLR